MTNIRRALAISLPLLISAAALFAVLFLADLDGLRALRSTVHWASVPWVAALVVAIVMASGWRWHTLMRESLPLRRSAVVAALGLAGNQVLPFRGGDALRVVLSARGPRAPSMHAGVSALALEKVFDLVAVAAFGLASASAIIGAKSGGGPNVIAVAVAILALAAVVLIAARFGVLTVAVRAIARALNMHPRLYRHVFRPLHHVRQSASPGRLLVILAQTAMIWLLLYVLAYLLIAEFVGMSLSVSEAMALLFAAALGLAIPAAPSGLGTFHAAIVSAFVLLGRPAADGLVLAIAIHGVFFVGFCVIGAVALAIATRKLGSLRVRGEKA